MGATLTIVFRILTKKTIKAGVEKELPKIRSLKMRVLRYPYVTMPYFFLFCSPTLAWAPR